MGLDLSRYTLVFTDEFDALSMAWDNAVKTKGDKTWWGKLPYGAASQFDDATWDPANLSISDGCLAITARKGANGKWTSGAVSSVDPTGAGFKLKYGYFEARMKMPASGRGAWPSFWLKNDVPHIPNFSEIDVVEWYGNKPAQGQQGNINWNGNTKDTKAPHNRFYAKLPNRAALSQDFHSYGVQIDPAFITFFFDGAQTGRITTPTVYVTLAPFYLMIDYALGGGYNLSGMVDGSTLLVDWVRAYALPS